MFKTIFSKLIAVFICILLVSFSLTGALLYYFLTGSVYDKKVEVLKKSAENVTNYLKGYVQYQNNPFAELSLSKLLEIQGFNTDSIVWVVTKEGYIYKSTEMSDFITKNR